MTQMAMIRAVVSQRPLSLGVMATCFIAVAGCDRSGIDSGDKVAANTRPASAWQSVGEVDSVVAIDDAAMQKDLDAAIAKARETMDAARARFNAATPQDRSQWLIKWAADVASGEESSATDAIEYVWIAPINWSPFRIEGVLVSQPVHELTCGKTKDDLVSFPVEELADWHCNSGAGGRGASAQSGDAQGGFTIAALKSKYGTPPSLPPGTPPSLNSGR